MVGIGVFVLLVLVYNDSTTPISTTEVVDDFRAEATTDEVITDEAAAPEESVAPVAPAEPSATPENAPAPPEPGVYLYTTSGDEGIDALNGTRHAYPEVTTVTVQHSACGAKYRWAPLEERTQEWELCRFENGLSLVGYASFHQFFGQDDHRELQCEEPLLLVPATPESGVTHTATCTGGTLEETWVVSVIGTSAEDVGGVEVDVVEVAVEIEVGSSDDSTFGNYVASYRFDADTGLLVTWEQISATAGDAAVGIVNYDETFDLRLTDVEPQT